MKFLENTVLSQMEGSSLGRIIDEALGKKVEEEEEEDDEDGWYESMPPLPSPKEKQVSMVGM